MALLGIVKVYYGISKSDLKSVGIKVEEAFIFRHQRSQTGPRFLQHIVKVYHWLDTPNALVYIVPTFARKLIELLLRFE